MFELFVDPAIYRFLDYGPPPSVEHVRQVYARLERRVSPDGTEGWLNWIVRGAGGQALGVVQATLVAPSTAWVAYVLASRHWRQGHGLAATRAMIDHLQSAYGATRFMATVEVANHASAALLRRLGFELVGADQAHPHELSATERLYQMTRPPWPPALPLAAADT
jgi:RimJ/RimL family protein N-acetyltransferase